ncbi:MAG TPA: KpsF/GutQ family sugar-phosphate isomerase [Pirellulaceae bacterium]|nr:KpsF/GutQ family sugar-phosphate isomerase [Pirellulaceae bacterium]
MAAAPLAAPGPLSPPEQLRLARQIVRTEGQTLVALAERLGDEFCRATDLILGSRGSVIVSGMGKAGLIGQKIAATLASTGTRSHFVHPAEAIHGDLGRVHADDVALVLSFSGQTEEVVRILPPLAQLGVPIIALTGQPASVLGRAAAVILDLGAIREACPLGLAPTASTTAMLALGDALALVLSRLRQFSPADFARYHPGGSLGRKLSRVEEAMRPLAQCRLACASQTLRQTLVEQSRPGRRTGAVMVTDDAGKLVGIFTDSDLARLLEANRDAAIDGPLADVMTRTPTTVASGTLLTAACELLSRRKLSELPVVDADGHPLGLIDITDVLGEQVQGSKLKVQSQRKSGRRSLKVHQPG